MRYAVLFEAAKGEPDDNGDPARIRAFGAMVSRLHQVADSLPGPYQRQHLDISHLVDDNLRVISSLMRDRHADMALITKFSGCRQG